MEDSSSLPAFSLEKAERLSTLLFPKWDEYLDLKGRINELQIRRLELLKVERSLSEVSDEMANAMMLTSNLQEEIETFRFNLGARVKTLIGEAKEAKLAITDMESAKVNEKVRIVQQGGMLLPDDMYGDWEYEYDSDDDEGRGYSNIVNIDAVIKAGQEKLEEINNNINFEGTIDKMLRRAMSEFALEANMEGVELDDWSRNPQLHQFKNIPVSVMYRQMGVWFVEKFNKAVEDEEKEEEVVRNRIAKVEVNKAATLADLSVREPYVPTCFTCKKSGHVDRDCTKVDIVEEIDVNDEAKYAHLAHRGGRFNRNKPKFCTVYKKSGHVDEYCPVTHPEEDGENDCSHCGRDGHRADTCWRLHPELKSLYLQKQQNRKLFCENCFQAGHHRYACTTAGRTYKYGLRPSGA